MALPIDNFQAQSSNRIIIPGALKQLESFNNTWQGNLERKHSFSAHGVEHQGKERTFLERGDPKRDKKVHTLKEGGPPRRPQGVRAGKHPEPSLKGKPQGVARVANKLLGTVGIATHSSNLGGWVGKKI